MGIRFFTTFVDKIPSVWTQESLQNTPVIIDGNALKFFLYNNQTDCRAGGEFDKFSRDIEKFFANFAGQNVTPYVVLDGATVKKLETVIKRTEDKIETCYNLSKGKSAKSAETKVLSPLAKMTFITKLRSLGIEFTVCDREADEKIAILANQKNCPVISNDSDFFIYDLPEGYIPLKKFNYNDQDLSHGRFSRDKLSLHLKIPSSFLPLLASLLGNDYVPEDILTPFKKSLSPIQPCTPDEISHFLQKSKEGGIERALQSVLDIVPKDNEKESLKKSLSESMAEYDIVGSQDGVSVTEAESVPGYVIDRHRKGNFPSKYMGVIFSKQNILTLQIEDIKQKSANRCSEKLRRVIYGIVLKPGQEGVTEWDRKDGGRSLLKRTVQPDRDSVELPNLENLETQGEERRRMLMSSILMPDSTVELPENKELFVMSIRYWIAHADPKVTKTHVQALILQHLQTKTIEKMPNFDISLQHSLAQWHSVMAETMSLNQILLNAFPDPDMSTLYNGAASQMIMHELSQGKPLNEFFNQMDDQRVYEMIYNAATVGLNQRLQGVLNKEEQVTFCHRNRFAVLQDYDNDD